VSAPERQVLEAILFLAEEPISAGQLGEVLERPRAEIEGLLADLAEGYLSSKRGFVLRRAAGGWRLYTSPECAPWLERFVRGHSQARLTGAALEVLAIIAYRQPIARSQIAELRGVDSDGVVRTLLGRGLIEEVGRDDGPGSPVLFALSNECLERLGLASVNDLPPLRDFMPDAEAVEAMESRLSPNA
jgi:segregation and condensation protein B